MRFDGGTVTSGEAARNTACQRTMIFRMAPFFVTLVACSRRSDRRAREKNSRREKNEGRLEGEGGEAFSRSRAPPPVSPSPSPIFAVYNLTRSPLTAALYYLNACNRLGVYLQIKLASRRLFRRGVYSSCGAKSIIYGNCTFAWKKEKMKDLFCYLGS